MKIKELKIYTSNLAKQIDFYSNKIGLKLIEQTALEAKFQIGKSILILIADETGLFICIDKNSKGWFPTGDKAYASEFEIRFEENETEHKLEFKREKINEVL